MSADEDDVATRRARFLRQLASRDLYAWFGIPRDADDTAIREAAERKRRALAGTPMPQRQRGIERTFCDQGEKALLRPDIRRDYDALLNRAARAGSGTAAPMMGADARAVREREERLRRARERIQHYGPDDSRMMAGSASLLGTDEAEEELAGHYRDAARIKDGAEALAQARRARQLGQPLRSLAFAERAHRLAPGPPSLNTLGAARRDTGDLAGSEQALRESVAQLGTVRENAPGMVALAATLRARGRAEQALVLARKVLDENDEDAHAWRVLAMASGDLEQVAAAVDAWERSARLGLDPPGALAGLESLRRDRLARGDQRAAAEIELRIGRLRLD